MSYCRFSSMDWKCDLYIYGTLQGDYVLHVAATRVAGEVPPMVWPAAGDDSEEAMQKVAESYGLQMEYIARADRAHINHPLAGHTQNVPNLNELRALLLLLRKEGFVFPDQVLERIADELGEINS